MSRRRKALTGAVAVGVVTMALLGGQRAALRPERTDEAAGPSAGPLEVRPSGGTPWAAPSDLTGGGAAPGGNAVSPVAAVDGLQREAEADPATPSLPPEERAQLQRAFGEELLQGGLPHRIESICAGGLGEACALLGDYYRAGRHGLPVDEQLAIAHYRKGCELGEVSGCGDAGALSGDLHLLIRGCDGGYGKACATLGDFYAGKALAGQQLDATDDVQAAHYYELACEGWNGSEGCASLGQFYREGRGVSKDEGLARRLLFRACRSGAAWACDQTG